MSMSLEDQIQVILQNTKDMMKPYVVENMRTIEEFQDYVDIVNKLISSVGILEFWLQRERASKYDAFVKDYINNTYEYLNKIYLKIDEDVNKFLENPDVSAIWKPVPPKKMAKCSGWLKANLPSLIEFFGGKDTIYSLSVFNAILLLFMLKKLAIGFNSKQIREAVEKYPKWMYTVIANMPITGVYISKLTKLIRQAEEGIFSLSYVAREENLSEGRQ